MRRLGLALAAVVCCLAPGSAQKATETELRRAARWADWVEPNFPFFSSVLDAGRAGPGFPVRNLTPRGLVLRIGRDQWVGFDTDLLRIAAIWRGKGVTPAALAPGSYHQPDKKTAVGQVGLPEPDGKVWLANGIYPGWQIGDQPAFEDPREPAPSPEEVGRGPLPESLGRFTALRRMSDATRIAVPNRKLRSLSGRIVSSFREAMMKTCCAASSARSSLNPKRRSERHTKSNDSSSMRRRRAWSATVAAPARGPVPVPEPEPEPEPCADGCPAGCPAGSSSAADGVIPYS